MKQNNLISSLFPLSVVTKLCLVMPFTLFVTLVPQDVKARDLELQVGIVQRFGDELEDEISIASLKGDFLSLTLPDSSTLETKTLQTERLTLKIKPQSLSTPLLEERLVLGDHATFETAEDDANHWKASGIYVEVTQPGRWQVWAKRDVYQTPLLRRLLLNSLQEQGYDEPYIETAILLEKPEVSFEIAGNSYQVTTLAITTEKNFVQVREGKKNSWRLYGGSLKIQANAYGDYTLVNQVPLETYLRGVVPHEIGRNAPRAAAEAQTIIARTYALRNTRRFQADNYQLCANTHCQIYYGLDSTSPISDRAIAATKGLVLTYNDELVDALYSSTTGGITASFSDIWNGEERPYLKSVIDAPRQVWDLGRHSLASEDNFRRFISLKSGFNETGRRVFRWHRQSNLGNLTKDLQKYLEKRKHPLADFTTIKQIEITERSPSGRILKLNVETDKGIIQLEKTEVRSAFAPPPAVLFFI